MINYHFFHIDEMVDNCLMYVHVQFYAILLSAMLWYFVFIVQKFMQT